MAQVSFVVAVTNNDDTILTYITPEDIAKLIVNAKILVMAMPSDVSPLVDNAVNELHELLGRTTSMHKAASSA